MGREKFTVSWIMADEPLLKLKESNQTYDIAKDVFDKIKENKLYDKEDFVVEVEIDKNKGDNGTITYLKEVDGKADVENKKEKTETVEKDKDKITKELTVHGVSVDKKGVIFKEEEKVWYTLDDSLDVQSFKDTCTGKTIEVYIKETDNGNDIITGFTLKEEKKETGKEDNPKYNNTGNSIEAQASLKCAKVIVASMVTPNSEQDFVLKLITKIANHAYDTIQELKKKE